MSEPSPRPRAARRSGATRAASAARRPLLHAAGVERLRAMIVRGELVPGEKLNERVLAARLGISRTPLRTWSMRSAPARSCNSVGRWA